MSLKRFEDEWVREGFFDWFTEDFLEYEERQGSRRPSLIDYVNRYRDSESQIPTDYRVRFAKYDKSLNRQP